MKTVMKASGRQAAPARLVEAAVELALARVVPVLAARRPDAPAPVVIIMRR